MGFPQGTRDAGMRHAHVIMHVPASVPMDTPFQRMKVKTAIQTEWLRVRDRDAPLWLWARCIDGSADSKAVATYVSRELTPTLWERETSGSLNRRLGPYSGTVVRQLSVAGCRSTQGTAIAC